MICCFSGIVEQGRRNEIFYGKPPGKPGGLPYFGAPVEHARWILGSKKGRALGQATPMGFGFLGFLGHTIGSAVGL